MLENTDAALAKILDIIGQAGTPDAISTAGQVAMYSAQGDLLCAHVFLVLSGIGLFLFAAGFALSASSSDEGSAFMGFLCFILLIIFGFSLTSSLSPLNIATAKDPKLAFAYMIMEKFKEGK